MSAAPAPNEPVLLRRDEGAVAILTLNRPHALNALSGELIDALKAEFDRLATDKSIRQGASDEGEMGVMHALFQPQRETNLLIRLHEYLRFGLHAGVFYAS